MSLAEVLVLAALQGLADVLPISAGAHTAVARIFLGVARDPAALVAAFQIAVAAAILVLARRPLVVAFGEGVRAIARPRLFQASPGARDAVLLLLGCAVSLPASALLRPFVALWSEAPLAQGLGLLITGAALASAAIAPPGRGRVEQPSGLGMIAAALAHGLGVAPGGSRMGA
ncbi:MAG TPA: undecaprenyl-diphosphate phosphatase, partial [Candidatus Nanopelagicales bacterium]|nr:undecaprenyl-diphosphate phosphatase [Candidatus Nanopelagicales bacterium]